MVTDTKRYIEDLLTFDLTTFAMFGANFLKLPFIILHTRRRLCFLYFGAYELFSDSRQDNYKRSPFGFREGNLVRLRKPYRLEISMLRVP